MPPEKTPPKPEPKPPREQEQSIKARKSEMFEDPSAAAAGPVKPFAQYLDQTPGAPLSKGERMALWAAAAVAVLLFLAALATIRPQKKRIVYKTRTPAVAQPATPAEAKAAAPEASKAGPPETTKATPGGTTKAAATEPAKAAPK